MASNILAPKKRKLSKCRRELKKFRTQRQSYKPSQVTLLVQWRDWKFGFRHQEGRDRVLQQAQTDNPRLVYIDSDIEQDWYWFGPQVFKSKQSLLAKFKGVHPPAIPENLHVILNTLARADAVYRDESLSPRTDHEESQERVDKSSSDDSFLDMDEDCDRIKSLYWDAKDEGFHDKRGKVFTQFLLDNLFKLYFKIETKSDYSTEGHDSTFDRTTYICAGPTQQESGDFHDPPEDRDTFFNMLKAKPMIVPLDNTTRSKLTSGVYVWAKKSLVLIAEVGNQGDDPEEKKTQIDRQLLHMLSIPDRAPCLIGWLVQRQGILLSVYHMSPSTKEVHRICCDTLFQYRNIDDMESLAKLMYCIIKGDTFDHIHV